MQCWRCDGLADGGDAFCSGCGARLLLPASKIDYPKAPLWGRCAALVFDVVIASSVFISGWIWYSVGVGALGSSPGALLMWLGGAWGAVYMLTRDGWPGGQSLGKRLCDLMVVKVPEGVPATATDSVVRQSVLLGTNVVPLLGSLVEPAVALTSASGRRIGDMVAGTQVVNASDWADVNGIEQPESKAFAGVALGLALVMILLSTLMGMLLISDTYPSREAPAGSAGSGERLPVMRIHHADPARAALASRGRRG